MIYRILAILAFVALVVGLVVTSGQQRETAAPITVEEPLRDPGYAARKAELVQTGPDGRPLYTVDADVVRQLPNEGTVQLETVRLGFRDTKGYLWTARAQQGVVGQETGIVELSGDVHVDGTLPGTQDPAQILTNRLSYDSNAQLVSTPLPVTLIWSGHRLNARGLLASLKDNRVQLESAVHGTFSQ
jgi:LPS export ABC transporter protein LptC